MAATADSGGGAEPITRRPRRLGTLRRLFRALRRSDKGISAVEFALASPVLLALLVPILDIGFAFSEQIKVQQAAQAGGEYAAVHGFDKTAIKNAVTGATTFSGVRASPDPTEQCGCISGTTVTLSAMPCTTTCANGLTPGIYVTVSAQAAYTPMTPYASYLNAIPSTLTATSIVRVQ